MGWDADVCLGTGRAAGSETGVGIVEFSREFKGHSQGRAFVRNANHSEQGPRKPPGLPAVRLDTGIRSREAEIPTSGSLFGAESVWPGTFFFGSHQLRRGTTTFYVGVR